MKIAKAFMAGLVGILMLTTLSFAQTVTFKVDMSVKKGERAFDPAADLVYVRGSMNNWGSGYALTDGNGDFIYEGAVDFSAVALGNVTYKFMYVKGTSEIWESDPNRTFDYTGSGQTLAVDYFDRDAIVNLVAPVRIYFEVDMSVQVLGGGFNPATDYVGIRGAIPEFGSWSATQVFTAQPGSNNVYERAIEIASYAVGSELNFKFVTQAQADPLNTTSAGWEAGDNRIFTVSEADLANFDGHFYQYLWASNSTDCNYFSCVTPAGILTRDVEVTFQVDVSSAVKYLTDHPDSCLIDVQSSDPAFWVCDPGDIKGVYINGSSREVGSWWGWGNKPPQYLLTDKGNNMWEWKHTFRAGHAKSFEYKFGLNSNDNESLAGANHVAKLTDTAATMTVPNCFGSLREDIANWPRCATYNDPILVTFKVDMSVKKAERAFDPATDIVYVRGALNNWDPGFALTDANGDLIYEAAVDFSAEAPGAKNYKFAYVKGTATQWESDPNRTFDYTGSSLVLAADYFDRDAVVNLVAPVRIFFEVDMSVQVLGGGFNPATDYVGIRGAIPEFGSWSATQVFTAQPGSNNVYERAIEIASYAVGSELNFKFVTQAQADPLNTTSAGWEAGDNRIFTVSEADLANFDGHFYQYLWASNSTDCNYFSCVTPAGILTRDVEVTFQVDVSSAVKYLTDHPDSCLIDVQSSDPAFWVCDPGDIKGVYINGSSREVGSWWGWGNKPPQYLLTDKGNHMWEWKHTFRTGHAKSFEYKFGLNSNDNESLAGANHVAKLTDVNARMTVSDCFGSLREDIADWPSCATVGIEEDPDGGIVEKTSFQLFQNHPNPTRAFTTIAFRLDTPAEATLTIYNTAGQNIREFNLGHVNGNAILNVAWDGRDNKGNEVTSGVYLYAVKAGNQEQSRKMTVIR